MAKIMSSKEIIEQQEIELSQALHVLSCAIDYINECPCDPDIYPDQYKAYQKLKDALSEHYPDIEV